MFPLKCVDAEHLIEFVGNYFRIRSRIEKSTLESPDSLTSISNINEVLGKSRLASSRSHTRRWCSSLIDYLETTLLARYYRFNLSHRDIEDLLAERGITVRRFTETLPALRRRIKIQDNRPQRGEWVATP